MLKNIITKLMAKDKYHFKIVVLLSMIILFSMIYTFLDTSHFTGVNPLQDKIKEEIIEEEVTDVTQQVQEPIINFKEIFSQRIDKDKIEAAQDVKEVVKNEEEKLEKPTFFQNFFDAFYFSVITACLLGSGDIIPASNLVKLLVCIQTLFTVCLILY